MMLTKQCAAIPKVSIGMPVYNGEKYIREALDSLLSQAFSDFELIISDNASIDGTEAICLEYAVRDPRIRYIRQTENRGLFMNFQVVLDAGVGEYFMWAAADDLWDEQWIATLLPISVKYQCLAYGFVEAIDEYGNTIPHTANGRRFEFIGNRAMRKLKYFMLPGSSGKANPIYGIAPISYLRTNSILGVQSAEFGGDMIFLFSILNDIEIRHGDGIHFKRIHGECAGGGLSSSLDRSLGKKFAAFFGGAIRGGMLGQCIDRSTKFESAFLLLIYPACVLRILLTGLSRKLGHRAIYAVVGPHCRPTGHGSLVRREASTDRPID